MGRRLALVVVAAVVIGACGPSGGSACPPPGPWPAPPGCPGGPALPGGTSGVGPAASGAGAASGIGPVSFTALVQPRFPGQRDPSAFPPSCDMLPTSQAYGAVARVQCQDYKKGAMIFWQEDACAALPFESGKQTCRAERETLRKLGDENAAKMRAADPGWWKTPYLNTYAFGDIRLRTEELGLTARVFAAGSWWGWRDDETFMAHATGVRTMPSHSFVKGPGQAALKRDVMKAEGIVVSGPQDLQKPEYVRVDTDITYLLAHSPEYRKVAVAAATDLDGKAIKEDRCDNPMAPPRDKCKSDYTLYMDATVAEFQRYVISWSQEQIDGGVEGIHFDDTGGLHAEEAFNPDTMRRFREWLAARPDVVARAGIADASSFDYRSFLVGRGYTKASLAADLALPYDGWRKVPLMAEFRTFYNGERERAFAEIVKGIRAYAASKGRSDLVITGNDGELAPGSAVLVRLFDMFSFEHDYLGPGKDPFGFTSVVPVAKLANAKERPVTNEQVMGKAAEAQLIATRLKEPLRSDVIRLQIMDSEAGHTAAHFIRDMQLPIQTETTDEDTVYLAMEDRSGLAEVKKAFGFIQRYRDTYRDIALSPAKVAIVYDNDEVAREWRDDVTSDHQGAVIELSKALWAKNVEFDIVNWTQLAAGAYTLVALPPSKTLTADRIAVVNALRAKGAKVYALWQLPAGVSVDGKVNGDALAPIAAAAAPPLALPAGTRSVRYVDGKGGTIVHLLNYEFDASGFKVKTDVKIDPAFLGGATSVTYSSIEHPDPVTLDPKDPRIPQLTTYGLIVARK